MKFRIIFLLTLVLSINQFHAQQVGGTGSNQSAPKEVKAAELSKGAYTSDVNLYTGTMATSYDLGMVSTFSGLSYKLQLNYSTTKTVGHNPGIVRGLSYGDGWNVNIPTISVTVEAFQNLHRAYEDPLDHCKLLSKDDAEKEGNLVWFAPFISIPGVVSDRFILKTIDTVKREMVFVPNVMEKYIEARLRINGSTWRVINDNGDVYDFKTVMTNYRAPSQLNYVVDSMRNSDGVSKNNLLPKEEPVTWYCNNIYNNNHPSDQQIQFQYEGYGTFNFYKEFKQPTLKQHLGLNLENSFVSIENYVVPFRDILLTSIESHSSRGPIERLELNYKTILPPPSASKDMLLITEKSVRRHDSLYNYRIVYSDGVDNSEDSLQLHSNAFHASGDPTPPLSFNSGLNEPNEIFSVGWRRYLHVMHPDANAYRHPFVPSHDAFQIGSNPYLFKKITEDVNGQYFYQNSITSSTPNSEIAFNHGFLETPRINNDIIPGDLYEIKSYIKNYNIGDEHLQICNFDINVVSGSGAEIGNSSNKTVNGNDYSIGTRGCDIYSTFNNPVKWTSAAHNIVGSMQPPHTINGFIVTSNMFLMPGLPRYFNGINVQIGPANSDHDYSLDLQYSHNNYFTHTGTHIANSYYAYKYLQDSVNSTYPHNCFGSPYNKPSQNFGIGLPWLMMKDVYADLTNDADKNHLNEHYQFWWKDTMKTVSGDVYPYFNVPTSLDEDVRLAAFELVRYSKNPYMLNSVKKYKFNGYAHTTFSELNTGVLVNQLDMKYSFKLDRIYSYVYTQQSVPITKDTTVGCTNYLYSSGHSINIMKLLRRDTVGYQNIYLLDEIKQVPVNGSMANAPSSYVYANLPATHFYYSKMNSDSLIGRGTSFNFAGNVYLINKIVDQLGGTMKYEYYPLHDVYHTHFANTYVDNNHSYIPSPTDYYHRPTQHVYKVQITVKAKQYFNPTSSTIPVKSWLYDYSEGTTFPGPCNNGAPILLADPKIWGTGNNFIHNSIDIDFGFLTTIVKYPQLNSATAVPYDKYTHYYHENRHLTLGKLKQVEKFDASGQLLSKKTYDYKATMAFGNVVFTGNKSVSSVLNEIEPEYTSEYEENFPYALPPNFKKYFYQKSALTMCDPDIQSLEMDSPSLFQSTLSTGNRRYPNCYFVRLVKETNTDYDYTPIKNIGAVLITEPKFRGVKLSDSGTDPDAAEAYSGINSMKMEASMLTSTDPTLATSKLVPLMTRSEMTNVTEYEYWDADSLGFTTSDGFEQLLNPDATPRPEILLNYEPSFELFRTKTYSPQLAGAYNTTESYYYYDVKQDVNKLPRFGLGNSYNDPSHFDALNFCHEYGIRNLMYQKRVTSKAVNQNPIAKSEYYWYDVRTKNDTIMHLDTLYITGLIDACTPQPEEPDTLGTDSIPDTDPDVDPYLGCYPVPHPITPPPAGWHFTEINPGEWWFCPGAISVNNDQTLRQEYNREYIYPSNLGTQLLLRRIDEQIDTVRPNLTFYGKHEPIMRFYEMFYQAHSAGPMLPQNDYNWAPGYKTKTKYRTLEHTPMGLVKLDMNERGLKTRYDYDTVFSVTIMDPVLGCVAGGAWDSNNQGVPRCITVGAFQPDSLTTCYVYNKDFTVNSITDPNGMVLSYYYDNFSRMRMAMRNGDTLSVNEYSQWMNDTTLDFEHRADQNFVESYILLNKGSKTAEHSRAYIDPLGRKYDVQTQITSNYTNPTVFDTLMVHSGLTTYDNWDRVSRQYKPFKYTNSGSPVVFAPRFNLLTTPYTEQQYENNQRGRVLRAAKFGESINVGHTVNSTYAIIKGTQLKAEIGVPSLATEVTGESLSTPLQAQRYLKTAAIDEDGKKTITYTNALGQKVAVKTYGNLTGQEVTAFIYDSQGNLKKVVNPNLQNTTYEYNLSGNLFRKVSVDADTVKYMYDISGNVVLEQDANGKHGRDELYSELYMRKYKYDIFGRMVQQDRIHYNNIYDPLRYQPHVYGYFSGISDTTKAFYNFTNTATLDFYGGWIAEKCTDSLYVFKTVPPGELDQDPWNPIDPDFDPGTDPTDPPVSLCSMVHGNVYDSLTLSAHEKKWAYHFPVNPTTETDLSTTFATYLGTNVPGSTLGQNYLKGRLSMTKSYRHDGTFGNLKVFGYNGEGLMQRELVQFNEGGWDNNINSIIHYVQYNLRNSLTAQRIDVDADGNDDKYYDYEYDGWNRLRTLRIGNDKNNLKKLASYNYDDALGLVTKATYYNPTGASGCNPAVDSVLYSYDIRNRLTLLNSKLYNEKLYYDLNKPQTYQAAFSPIATKNFNGNINGLVHTFSFNPTTNYAVTSGIMDSSTVYGYTYDGLNRLLLADASVLNVLTGTAANYTPKLDYGNEVMIYDRIGNISTLKRGAYYNPSISTPPNLIPTLAYEYQTGSNHLMDVDTGGVQWRRYNYDENGNAIRQIQGKAFQRNLYMRSNLPRVVGATIDSTSMFGHVEMTYDYNSSDDRVYKLRFSDTPHRNYYLRDASGKELADLDLNANQWTLYAYGRERVADLADTTLNYYIYDHLGSVRVMYSTDGNCTTPAYTIENANDYYAFGHGLRSFNNTGRYGYQGSYKESELSDNDYYTHFRGLDADVARWKQIDPKLSHSESPYVSMSDNPVNLTDPNGDTPGGPECLTCPLPRVDKVANSRQDNLVSKQANIVNLDAVKTQQQPQFVADNRGSHQRAEQAAYTHQVVYGGGNGKGGFADKYFEAKHAVVSFVNDQPATVQLAAAFVAPITAEFRAMQIMTTAEVSSTALTSFYPSNGGALNGWKSEFLMPGTKIDRFGSGFGKYFSPMGTPMEMRALPAGNSGAYNAFQVLKPFEVQSSTIAPAFGRLGLGTQYMTPVNMNTLLKRGIIGPIQ